MSYIVLMGIRNARSIGPEELSDRRRQAVALFQQGYKRREIAPIVGAHRNVVGQWIKNWQENGESAFAVGHAGRPRGSGMRLSGWQASAIKRLITDKTPDQLKFAFALWTRQAVKELIKKRYGIDLPIRTVGEYLKRWGFTPQRPIKRAYERCNSAVRKWLNVEYPEIAKRAKAEDAEIHWGDEAGIRSDDVTGRGYSLRGHTPVVKRKGKRERLSMLSAITNRGHVRFSFFTGALNADKLIRFLKRLIRDTDRKVFIILDNLNVHHSHPVVKWQKKHADQIEIFYLPKYSPDLNPDEFLNSQFKQELGKRPDRRSKGSLETSARSVMHSLQKHTAKILACFRAPTTIYAA
jgi:transposase